MIKPLCRSFVKNACNKGDNCKYSHDVDVYPCKFHLTDGECHNNPKTPKPQKNQARFLIANYLQPNILKENPFVLPVHVLLFDLNSHMLGDQIDRNLASLSISNTNINKRLDAPRCFFLQE